MLTILKGRPAQEEAKMLIQPHLLAKKPQELSGLTIRPFNPTDEEYATVLSIWNAVWPEWKTEIESYK